MVNVDDLLAVPVAIARAVRALDKHPQILGIDIAPRDDEERPVDVTLQIKSELPSRFKGESPSGVRRIEPVTLSFPISYPLFAPRPTLRDDFDRSHPHLQPGGVNAAPEPCLVFGSPRELIQSGGGILALLQQLLDWLDRAAMLKLNDPKHGWEFVRRDHLNDLIVGDASKIRGLVKRKTGGTWHRTWVLAQLGQDDPYYRISLKGDEQVQIDDKTLKSLGQVPKDDDEWTGFSLGLIVWPGKHPDGKQIICDQYLPETVGTVKELYERAELYGCGKILAERMKWLRSKLDGYTIKTALPVTIILIARRPFNLIGHGSPLEICPYVIEFQSVDDLKPISDAVVRLAGHRDSISTDVLRRTSHGDPDDPWLSWSLLGCGSLGSKIAMHLSRSGRAPIALIDNDTMDPHNYARHSCLPYSADLDSMFYSSKAGELAHDIGKLAQDTAGYRIDANTVLRSKEFRKKVKLEKTKVVLNTTASSVLREKLSSTDWSKGKAPRVLEASLMGDSDIGFFSVSGVHGNPNSSDLMAEFYHHLRNKDALRSKIIGQSAAEIAIGQGCSSMSMIASDARLSTLAAPLATLASNVLSGQHVNETGQFTIGQLQTDGVSQSWDSHQVEPYTVVKGTAKTAPETRLSRRVTTEIDAEIARKPGSETGGVLIGRFSAIGNVFRVVDTISAPPDSKFSAAEFVLGVEGLKAQLDELSRSSCNTLYALGTWHNHLASTGPSNTDIDTSVKLAIGQLFPVLMLIRTPTGFRQLVAEAVGLSSDRGGGSNA
ncbi:ThiF family adenylyltransferase [uncultured Roseobacter sp.]|uniref:ThiF family adenylyltransferase n=1 Tax=uncultured Roseobacter sp. TaxID=114847 RepID=UPI00260FD61A|nr:ThiF family adenylyltransferase [uncultured Roseobacter sp.]